MARPVGQAERLWRWYRRNPWLAAANLSAVAAIVTLAVAQPWPRGRSGASATRSSASATAPPWPWWKCNDNARWARIGSGNRFRLKRAQRLAGQPWAALTALGEAAKIKPSNELRQEAIGAIAAQGVRLRYVIPFGRGGDGAYGFGSDAASGSSSVVMPQHDIEVGKPDDVEEYGFTADSVYFSDDGALMAVGGWYLVQREDPTKSNPSERLYQTVHNRIVILRTADGQKADRLESAVASDKFKPRSTRDFAFRPRSATLAFLGQQGGHDELRLRDPAQHQDRGLIGGVAVDSRAPSFLFSPDGTKLVVKKADRLCVSAAIACAKSGPGRRRR